MAVQCGCEMEMKILPEMLKRMLHEMIWSGVLGDGQEVSTHHITFFYKDPMPESIFCMETVYRTMSSKAERQGI